VIENAGFHNTKNKSLSNAGFHNGNNEALYAFLNVAIAVRPSFRGVRYWSRWIVHALHVCPFYLWVRLKHT
jgi:hypothetical protein